MFSQGVLGQNGDVTVFTNFNPRDAAMLIKRIAKREVIKGTGVEWPTDEETREYLSGLR